MPNGGFKRWRGGLRCGLGNGGIKDGGGIKVKSGNGFFKGGGMD